MLRSMHPPLPLLLLCALLALPVPGQAAADAPSLLDSSGCRGCHRLGGRGGSFAPPLDGVGKRLQRDQLRRQLLNPKAVARAALMPAYNYLSPREIETLVDFLAELK